MGLPTAEKQPIENGGVGVGAVGQTECFPTEWYPGPHLQHHKNEGYLL